MVRIKGANSDYKYDAGDPQQPIKEDKSADPLYMEIFICPNDQPSKIEKHEGDSYCKGTDKDCPSPDKKGHAKVRLDQKEGIILSVKDTDALKVSDEKISMFEPQNNKENSKENSQELTITKKTNSKEITIKFGKAEISLNSNGDIKLKGKLYIDDKPVIPT
ncbi:MAG: hypothetical protein F6K17_05160 [Okeania sp. SIO3C4]|nr:hypothetical protein [Okeania sp. SIO3C4]